MGVRTATRTWGRPGPTGTALLPAPGGTSGAQDPALSTLAGLRATDLQRVRLRGQWVAMLASKYVGVTDPLQTAANGTSTFGAADILAEHRSLRTENNRGARIVLLLSTDFGERLRVDGKELWMTFAVDDFSSEAAVRTWCEQRFPTLTGDRLQNACVPWRLDPPR